MKKWLTANKNDNLAACAVAMIKLTVYTADWRAATSELDRLLRLGAGSHGEPLFRGQYAVFAWKYLLHAFSAPCQALIESCRPPACFPPVGAWHPNSQLPTEASL